MESRQNLDLAPELSAFLRAIHFRSRETHADGMIARDETARVRTVVAACFARTTSTARKAIRPVRRLRFGTEGRWKVSAQNRGRSSLLTQGTGQQFEGKRACPSLQALEELAIDDRGRDDAGGPDGGRVKGFAPRGLGGLLWAERFAVASAWWLARAIILSSSRDACLAAGRQDAARSQTAGKGLDGVALQRQSSRPNQLDGTRIARSSSI